MGCDGGTIPTRDELVKTKKKPEQKDKDSVRLSRWLTCSLSQEGLRKPVVACHLGRLYNKEAVIHLLLDKTTSPANVDHIKSLKDVRELDLTTNPTYNAKNPSVGDNYVDRLVSPWICPITGLEMNGRFKFVLDWSTGRVMSERAYKMLKGDDAAKFQEEQLIVLNPEGEDADLMMSRMEARKARAKAEKKSKSDGKKRKEDAGEGTSDAPKRSKVTDLEDKSKKKPDSAASSVQQSAKSEVFKSLFTSHPSAQKKEKAHWVTFDPRYN